MTYIEPKYTVSKIPHPHNDTPASAHTQSKALTATKHCSTRTLQEYHLFYRPMQRFMVNVCDKTSKKEDDDKAEFETSGAQPACIIRRSTSHLPQR